MARPASRRERRVLLLFLDGVGIGPDEPAVNPFLQARLPVLRDLLGGSLPTLSRPAPMGGSARTIAMDACLGVPGLPQSGTGQISLLTGMNAARRFGAHFGPWPPVRLRELLERQNLLTRAVQAGIPTVFANAYPEGYPGDRPYRRLAAPPLAARAAGILTRHHGELARGEAVASEIVNQGWRKMLGFQSIPPVTAAEAGQALARLANGARLTLFAHYLTDLAGHRGGMEGAVAALERVDDFLQGIRADLDPDVTVVVASDHGNVEDVRAGHTRNPALGLVWGPEADTLASRCPDLTHVAPQLLRLLDVPFSHPAAPENGRASVTDTETTAGPDTETEAGVATPGSGDPGEEESDRGVGGERHTEASPRGEDVGSSGGEDLGSTQGGGLGSNGGGGSSSGGSPRR